jgi:hypothetical protein
MRDNQEMKDGQEDVGWKGEMCERAKLGDFI